MRIDFTRTSHILFFIGFLPGLSFAIGWAFFQFLPTLPFWIDTISPLAAYGILYAIFERTAWRWPIFSWLGIVTAPDVRGRWIGTQQSSHRNKDGKNMTSRVVLEIQQTFTDITARTYYKRWRVAHCDGSFIELDGEQHLVLLFESEPNSHHLGDDTDTKGVTRLYYVPGEHKLVGSYFSDNGNYGEVILTHRSHKLLHRFDA
ncbi:MAG TPA: hypothetical protein VM581_05065 [Magnetospirillaceae bacterium]|nr:hypothetical protein [Magnetospirillaceae bacterium]